LTLPFDGDIGKAATEFKNLRAAAKLFVTLAQK
jgi:hypothetical protein